MNEHGFRFSQDKRFGFGNVSFREFLATAVELCWTVSDSRGRADVVVLTSEDRITYEYSRVTFIAEEVTEALGKRKQYSLEKLTEEVWDRSLHVEVFLKDEQSTEPFMTCLSHDKYAYSREMRFYGQCLDEKTCQAILARFKHSSISHQIGDGFEKSSEFNLAVGARLTGMRLYR